MKESIAEYLTKLQASFDIAWIGNFKLLIEFLFRKAESKKIIDLILSEKVYAHEDFFKASSKLSEELRTYFNNIDKLPSVSSYLDNICLKISKLETVDTHSKQFCNTYERAEDLFYEVSRNLFPLIQQLLKNQALAGVIDSQIIEEYKGVYKVKLLLPFSVALKICELEAERLRNLREVSIWGKWDRVQQLYEWVKEGISKNDSYKNIQNVFSQYNYSEFVQDIGHYFIEQVEPSITQQPIKALELYLDGSNHYWILVHRGKGDFPETFHMKRLHEGKALNLLKRLLKSPENTLIECEEKLTKVLGELHIKGEIAKVIFPETAIFAGAYVELKSLGVSIDQAVILNLLHQLQANKKRRPLFDRKGYYQRSYLHNKPR